MKVALITAALLTTNLIMYPVSVEAVSDDNELSIMAAEQRKDDDANVTVREDVEVFDSNPVKTSVNDDAAPVNNNDIASEVDSNINVAADPVPIDTSITENVNNNENLQDSANPIVTYANFEEAARKVGYIPLYIPKKSGFAMNYIAVIGGNIVEIRYGKRWEPTVTLSVRTYKRSPNEELKDISGVQGVKWKVDLSSGMTIYIARVNNTTNAAAWSIGQYTFAAMAENMSFAAFHAFIVEELVDLCNHYFINI